MHLRQKKILQFAKYFQQNYENSEKLMQILEKYSNKI